MPGGVKDKGRIACMIVFSCAMTAKDTAILRRVCRNVLDAIIIVKKVHIDHGTYNNVKLFVCLS